MRNIRTPDDAIASKILLPRIAGQKPDVTYRVIVGPKPTVGYLESLPGSPIAERPTVYALIYELDDECEYGWVYRFDGIERV